MKPIQRFLIGGVGGMAPVLIFLANVDWDIHFAGMSTMRIVGYCSRIIILFLIGGFTAYLYNDETNYIKLFQLGISAPALVAGYISTANIPATQRHVQLNPVGILGPSQVYAQTDGQFGNIKKYTLPIMPPPSKAEEFWVGLSGKTPKPPQNVWFVVAGSFLSLEDALAEAAVINKQYPGFNAEVYDRDLSRDDPYYTVVIGAHLAQAEAKKLKEKAIKAGLRKDIYVTSPPNLPPASP
jgi:hypothetical protein